MHSARFPRKALDEALPAGGRIEDFADHSRLLAETVKVSVLKLDPCPVHTVGNEMNLQSVIRSGLKLQCSPTSICQASSIGGKRDQ